MQSQLRAEGIEAEPLWGAGSKRCSISPERDRAAKLQPFCLQYPCTSLLHALRLQREKKKKQVLAAASFAKSMSWFLHIRREKNRYLAFTCSNGILIWLLASGSCQLVRTIGVCIFQLSRRSDKGLLLGIREARVSTEGAKGSTVVTFGVLPALGHCRAGIQSGKERVEGIHVLMLCSSAAFPPCQQAWEMSSHVSAARRRWNNCDDARCC